MDRNWRSCKECKTEHYVTEKWSICYKCNARRNRYRREYLAGKHSAVVEPVTPYRELGKC